jgi:ATPase family associated with various cellular activities (AAA)
MARRKIKWQGYKVTEVKPPEFNTDKAYFDFIDKLFNKDDMQIEHYNEHYDDEGNEIEPTENWKNVVIDIAKIPVKKFTDKDLNLTFDDVKPFVYAENGDEGYFAYQSELNFFEYRYHHINNFPPNVYRFDQFNANTFITNLFKYNVIPENACTKMMFQGSDTPRISSILLCFAKNLLLYIDGPEKGAIYYDPRDESKPDSLLYTILGLLKVHKRPKVTQNKIYIVYRSPHGFDKMGFDISKIKIDLNDNYNDGFSTMSEKIIEGLNSKNKTNLVILSGETGTGKTSYIRYLTSKLKKNIIFISPDMVDEITDPAFIPFLMKNNDSVLIIEDAEPALEKRNQGGRSSAVSNVLNLTDGLLSDCLKISIVATFNTGTKNIDEALTRKGRLLMNYKFERLCAEKSKALLKKLGHEEVGVNEPMTLADIYFYGTDNNSQENNEIIGFGNRGKRK